jgi:hypothetical protein
MRQKFYGYYRVWYRESRDAKVECYVVLVKPPLPSERVFAVWSQKIKSSMRDDDIPNPELFQQQALEDGADYSDESKWLLGPPL